MIRASQIQPLSFGYGDDEIPPLPLLTPDNVRNARDARGLRRVGAGEDESEPMDRKREGGQRGWFEWRRGG
jgi:hypothetical protein